MGLDPVFFGGTRVTIEAGPEFPCRSSKRNPICHSYPFSFYAGGIMAGEKGRVCQYLDDSLNKNEIEMTRLNLDDKDEIQQLAKIAQELMDDIQTDSEMLTINCRTMGVQEFNLPTHS